MDFGSLFSGMQEKLQDVKTRLEALILDAEAGEGQVKVMVSGSKKLREIQIDPAMMDPDRKEELEDLICVAVNRALDKADVKAAEEMQAVTGGMLPGLGGLMG
jgi:DNA-binding YbaB/EbfC family protein